jgi:lambda repressor-like predicted transcriptional regulator
LVPQVPVTLDTKGRVRTSKGQRRTILAEFERSGMSAAQFAKRTGLKYSTLAGWLQRARRLRLLEAVVESTAGTVAGATLVLELPGGVRLALADERQAALAAVLVRELTKPC